MLFYILIWMLSVASYVEAKAVFAHFMVSNAANYSLSNWNEEISLAKTAHIDAFALNTAYNQGDAAQIANAFSAAQSLGFKLFFSFDYAGNGAWPKADVIEYLQKYGANSAHYTYNGKPFVSTFEGPGSAEDWVDIKAQTGCFFVPDWSSLGAKEAMSKADGVADGLFSWASWPWGTRSMDTYTDASYRQYLNGKPYMMPVSPWFYTNLPGYDKNWLWKGDNTWFDRWGQVLYVQPEWVEIISWNDYGESHYIGPIRSNALGAMTTGQAPFDYVTDMPHDGWRETLPFAIDMYVKNTTTIIEEKVIYWYRPQPATACSDGGTTGNTASQLQIEFWPYEVVEDRVFYTALLTSAADVTVNIGGTSQSGEWTSTPDGGSGLYHGNVPFSGSGAVTVTISRSGSTIASGTGMSISSSCTDGYENWNAWVGSAGSGVAVSVSPESMDDLVCIRGTGVNNFAGLCDFACWYGYCPIGACVCTEMGQQREKPTATDVTGYPAADLDENYSGLCSFDCTYGYCPDTACGTTSAPLTTATVSPFLPSYCNNGTGDGNWAGLCSYACTFGYCPIHICSCTSQGGLNEPPATIDGLSGSALDDASDYGLCNFACSRGYCPPGACALSNSTSSGSDGSGSGDSVVYIDPSIWNDPTPTVSCIPPCVLVLPPYTLSSLTTITFPPITTTYTESWTTGVSSTTVITVSFPPVTTSKIPVYNINITATGVDGITYTVTPSILPTTKITITKGSVSGTSTLSVVSITSTPTPTEPHPTITDHPTTIKYTSASPPGPTCTSDCGSECLLMCSDCGILGCGGICVGCGGSSGSCVGSACPADDGSGDDDEWDDSCNTDVDTTTGFCSNGNYPVWDPFTNEVSCDYSETAAPDHMTACQDAIDDDLDQSVEDASQSSSCCSASKRSSGVWGLLTGRAAACPVNPNFGNNPPANGVAHSTFICDYSQWPNVCANAESAIKIRNKSPIMTYAGPNDGGLHVTNPWYSGKYKPGPQATKPEGWGLVDCEVEEYPWGSGNPNRSPNTKIWDQQSVLRLIPRSENNAHAQNLLQFYRDAGNNNLQNAKGLVYSVSFINGPASPSTDSDFYLGDGEQASLDINVCAKGHGVAFLLVNKASVNTGERSYDPWWDNKLVTRVTNIATSKDGSTLSVQTGAIPSVYCKHPSPGRKTYTNGAWSLEAGAISQTRKRGNVYYSCSNYSDYAGPANMRRRGRGQPVALDWEQPDLSPEDGPGVADDGRAMAINDTSILQERNPAFASKRGHQARRRATGAGSFLDASAFDYLGCLNSDEDWCAWPGADCPDNLVDEDDSEDSTTTTSSTTTSKATSTKTTTTTAAATTTAAPTYDCKGSGLCGTLEVKYCDHAVNYLQRNDDLDYGTRGQDVQLTGNCWANSAGYGCGVFVQGTNETNESGYCQFTGNQMWWAYQDLRDTADCSVCGSIHYDDGCMITVNYVSDCDNRE